MVHFGADVATAHVNRRGDPGFLADAKTKSRDLVDCADRQWKSLAWAASSLSLAAAPACILSTSQMSLGMQ